MKEKKYSAVAAKITKTLLYRNVSRDFGQPMGGDCRYNFGEIIVPALAE